MEKIIDIGNTSLKVVYNIEDNEVQIKSMIIYQGELLDLLQYIEDYIECDTLTDYLIERIEEY
jgi:uncharacterized protein YydD (DUF2326 family)